MKSKKILIIGLILALFLNACGNQEDETENKKLEVYASFYPYEFLAQRIGGDKINLKTVIPNKVEPHDFEPSLKNIKDMAKSDIFIYNGLGLEPWAEDIKKNLDGDKIEFIEGSKYVPYDMDKDLDPHIWLNPKNMISIGEAIKDSFIVFDSENESVYRDNFNILEKELVKLDKDFKETLENIKGKEIIVSHKAFGHMGLEYGFEQIGISGLSGEEEPSGKVIADIIDLAKQRNIKYIFMEPLSSIKAVETIAKEGNLDILVLSPIETVNQDEQVENEDYISIMYKNLENLKKALVI